MVGDLDRFAALSNLGQVTASVLAQFPHPYLLHVLHGSTLGRVFICGPARPLAYVR